MLTSTSVASIESRHSSIRRHLTTRSVQTHPLPAHSLSAQWVMQNIRAGCKMYRQLVVPDVGTTPLAASK
eukprot:5476006-Amphidinium_carterae.1